MIEGAGDDQLNLRTVPTVTGTEEMRAFFQRRLAGAGLVMKGPTESGPVRSRTIALDVAGRVSTSFDRVRWRPA